MVNVGNWSLGGCQGMLRDDSMYLIGLSLAALILLGPIAWRKYASWRQEKARQPPPGNAVKRSWIAFPSPILLPSNLILTATFLSLVFIHLSYLFHPSKVLSRSDLFLLTNANVVTSVANVRSKVASMTFEELGWRQEWGEEGLETLLRRLSSFEGRVSTPSMSPEAKGSTDLTNTLPSSSEIAPDSRYQPLSLLPLLFVGKGLYTVQHQ
jgi:hypothetical protein